MKLRVKEILKSKKITQKELADRMGILPESLTRILAGGNPSLATLQRMAESLGICITELFDIEKEVKKVKGYIEIDNVVHKINSKDDLDKLYKQLSKK